MRPGFTDCNGWGRDVDGVDEPWLSGALAVGDGRAQFVGDCLADITDELRDRHGDVADLRAFLTRVLTDAS